MEALYAELISEVETCLTHAYADRAPLIARLELLARIARGHMEVEERYIVPVAMEFLTADDWIQIGSGDVSHLKMEARQ